MKDDTPHGSVFGGYGFFSYSGTQNNPSSGNGSRVAPRSSARPSLRQRMLLRSASAWLARWTRS